MNDKVFRIELTPEGIKIWSNDLNKIVDIACLCGDDKPLNRIVDSNGVERLWWFTVTQEQFSSFLCTVGHWKYRIIYGDP